MIYEIAGSPARSQNAYFANNEQASITVFTAVFCFTHAKTNLNKLKLFNNWSTQAVTVFQSVLYVKFKETNQIFSPLKISQSINAE